MGGGGGRRGVFAGTLKSAKLRAFVLTIFNNELLYQNLIITVIIFNK